MRGGRGGRAGKGGRRGGGEQPRSPCEFMHAPPGRRKEFCAAVCQGGRNAVSQKPNVSYDDFRSYARISIIMSLKVTPRTTAERGQTAIPAQHDTSANSLDYVKKKKFAVERTAYGTQSLHIHIQYTQSCHVQNTL